MVKKIGKSKRNIIGIFGKKQSGKTISCDFIKNFVPMHLSTHRFSFAGKLKRMVADIFNVDYNKLVGTEEDKNSSTHLYWGDVSLLLKLSFFGVNYAFNHGAITHRELLQLIGTNLFREIKNNIWVENTIRDMENSSADICIVDDARFKNELEAIRNAGGKLVKLYSIFDLDKDNHPSETLFDKMPDEYFDFVIGDYDKKRTIEQLGLEWEKIIKQIIGEMR